MSDQQTAQPTTNQNSLHKLLNIAMHALLYFSVFLAGFIAAKFHTLLMSI